MIFLGSHGAASRTPVGDIVTAASLATVIGSAARVLRESAALRAAFTVDDAAAHRQWVTAWVLADPAGAAVEVWLRDRCPHHDPPACATAKLAGSGPHTRSDLDVVLDVLHNEPHRVDDCACWCTGLSAGAFSCAAVVPAVPLTAAAALTVEHMPTEPGLSSDRRLCAWLAAASAAGVVGFSLFAALIVDGELPAIALSAAHVIAD
jgi:hypothetical protein